MAQDGAEASGTERDKARQDSGKKKHQKHETNEHNHPTNATNAKSLHHSLLFHCMKTPPAYTRGATMTAEFTLWSQDARACHRWERIDAPTGKGRGERACGQDDCAECLRGDGMEAKPLGDGGRDQSQQRIAQTGDHDTEHGKSDAQRHRAIRRADGHR